MTKQTEPRQKLASLLKKMREERAFSLEDLAETTKISVVFIKALESGELQKLPAEVFGRGFIKNICQELDQDSEALLDLYDQCFHGVIAKEKDLEVPQASPEKDQVQAKNDGKTYFKRSMTFSLSTGVLMIILLGGAYLYVSQESKIARTEKTSNQRPSEPQISREVINTLKIKEKTADLPQPTTVTVKADVKPMAEKPTKIPENQKMLETSEKAVIETTQTVTVEVISPVKVRRRIDGGKYVTEHMQPKIYHFSFEKQADFFIYNAASVSISFNGKPLGSLGKEGRRRRISFHGLEDSKKSL